MGRELAIEAETGTTIACNLCGAHAHDHLFTKFGFHIVRCRECDLVFVGNPPSHAAVEEFYTAENDYHDGLLESLSDEQYRQSKVAEQHVKMLRRFRPQLAGLKVLDIGCSSGIFLDRARQAGMEPYGAELSPKTAAFAREHFGLNVHCGDWRDAGHADGTFDVITLFDVIEHLPDPLGELEAIRRLLKPGGLLLQSTPDIDGLFPRMSYHVAKLLDYWPHPEPPHHLFQFSRKTLSNMVEKAGFTVEGARHTTIDLAYSFGTPKSWKQSPKMLAYAAGFAPVAIIGEWLGKGDWLYLGVTRD